MRGLLRQSMCSFSQEQAMNPISIHRAFDPQLDRIMQDMMNDEQYEDDDFITLQGFVGSLEVGLMFILGTWAIWLWL
jgi:hypothetical protein